MITAAQPSVEIDLIAAGGEAVSLSFADLQDLDGLIGMLDAARRLSQARTNALPGQRVNVGLQARGVHLAKLKDVEGAVLILTVSDVVAYTVGLSQAALSELRLNLDRIIASNVHFGDLGKH